MSAFDTAHRCLAYIQDGALHGLQDFVVSGTASSKLFGMAEALWEPNLAPDDLFETISQALLNVSLA